MKEHGSSLHPMLHYSAKLSTQKPQPLSWAPRQGKRKNLRTHLNDGEVEEGQWPTAATVEPG
jgi:hypothetical protein